MARITLHLPRWWTPSLALSVALNTTAPLTYYWITPQGLLLIIPGLSLFAVASYVYWRYQLVASQLRRDIAPTAGRRMKVSIQ